MTGTDRISFLHGQVSNDILGLPTPGACAALLLNVKGQIEFMARVFRRANDCLILTAPDLANAVTARLQKYIVFDDVQLFCVSEQFFLLHVFDDEISLAEISVVSELGYDFKLGGTQACQAELGNNILADVLVAPVQRTINIGFDILVSIKHKTALQEFVKLAGGQLATNISVLRVQAGLSDAHLDNWLGYLPQECGLERAVSYKKGCYIGQEIMARLEARGHTQRELHLVRSNEALISGEILLVGVKEIGRLGQVVVHEDGSLALAVLRKDAIGVKLLTSEAKPVELV